MSDIQMQQPTPIEENKETSNPPQTPQENNNPIQTPNENPPQVPITQPNSPPITNTSNPIFTNNSDKSTDTSDLSEQNFYSFTEFKKNYLNNLITWSFLQKLSEFHHWPLGCIGNFIQNSTAEEANSKNIYIDVIEQQHQTILTIKDDGKGISFPEFNQIMYSFSINQNKECNYFQYGLNLKTSAMKLANSFLLISKTDSNISIGLISKSLQIKIESDLILTPVVNYKITKNENEITYIPISNYPKESIHLIFEEISFLFKTQTEFETYLNSFNTGTHIFLYNLKLNNENQLDFIFDKNKPDIYYSLFTNIIGEENTEKYIDVSLVQYLNFLFLKHPSHTKIHLFNTKLTLQNPYYDIKKLSTNNSECKHITKLKYDDNNKVNCFNIEGENYKGIMFNKEYVMQLGNELISDTEDIKDCERFFNGVLVYKENVLVMRIGQNKLGEMAYFIKKANCNKMFFGVNGYVQLMDREYELMFNKKEIKNLAVFGFLYVKIKILMKQIYNVYKDKKIVIEDNNNETNEQQNNEKVDENDDEHKENQENENNNIQN
jgi:hypothetical protein